MDGIKFVADVQDHLAHVRHAELPGHWTFTCCRKGLAQLLGVRLKANDRVTFTLTATDVDKRELRNHDMPYVGPCQSNRQSMPYTEGSDMNATEKNERLTVGGIVTAFDTKNGFRSTELGTIKLDRTRLRELQQSVASGMLGLNDADWSGANDTDTDGLPVDIRLTISTRGADGFEHRVSLEYVIHGTQKWARFTSELLKIAGATGFVRDGAKAA